NNLSPSPNDILRSGSSTRDLKWKLRVFRKPFRFVSRSNSRNHDPAKSDLRIEQQTTLSNGDDSSISKETQPALKEPLVSMNAFEVPEIGYRNYSRPYQAHRPNHDLKLRASASTVFNQEAPDFQFDINEQI